MSLHRGTVDARHARAGRRAAQALDCGGRLANAAATLLLLIWQRRRVGAKPLWDSRDLRDGRAWAMSALALPVTALVFGALHLEGWWVAAIYGLAIGVIANRMRSLALPMIVHRTINFTVFVLLLTSGL